MSTARSRRCGPARSPRTTPTRRHRRRSLPHRGQPAHERLQVDTWVPMWGAPTTSRLHRWTPCSPTASARCWVGTINTCTHSAVTSTCGCSRTHSSITPVRCRRSPTPGSSTTQRCCRPGSVSPCCTAVRPNKPLPFEPGDGSATTRPMVLADGRRSVGQSDLGVLGRDGQGLLRSGSARRARLAPQSRLSRRLRPPDTGQGVFRPGAGPWREPDLRLRRRQRRHLQLPLRQHLRAEPRPRRRVLERGPHGDRRCGWPGCLAAS